MAYLMVASFLQLELQEAVALCVARQLWIRIKREPCRDSWLLRLPCVSCMCFWCASHFFLSALDVGRRKPGNGLGHRRRMFLFFFSLRFIVGLIFLSHLGYCCLITLYLSNHTFCFLVPESSFPPHQLLVALSISHLCPLRTFTGEDFLGVPFWRARSLLARRRLVSLELLLVRDSPQFDISHATKGTSHDKA